FSEERDVPGRDEAFRGMRGGGEAADGQRRAGADGAVDPRCDLPVGRRTAGGATRSLTLPPSRAYTCAVFTGIIEKTANVIGVAKGPMFQRLTIAADWPDVRDGESVAV